MGRKSPRCQQRETSSWSPTISTELEEVNKKNVALILMVALHPSTVEEPSSSRGLDCYSRKLITALAASLPSADTARNSAWSATKAPMPKWGHLRPIASNHLSHSCSLTHGNNEELPSLFISSPLSSPSPLCFFPLTAHFLTTENLPLCCLEPQLLVNKTPYILSLSLKCPLPSPDSAEIRLSSRWQACQPTPTRFPGQHTLYCFSSMPPP